jgi:hypothetical protein
MMKALSLGGSLLQGRVESVGWGQQDAPPPLQHSVSREHSNAVRRGGCTVALHVRVHLREARLDVGLCAALPHGPEAESLGWVVQLCRARQWSDPLGC